MANAFHGDLSYICKSIRLRFRNVHAYSHEAPRKASAETHTSSQRSFVYGTDGLTRRYSRDNHHYLRQEAVFLKKVPTVHGIDTLTYLHVHWNA